MRNLLILCVFCLRPVTGVHAQSAVVNNFERNTFSVLVNRDTSPAIAGYQIQRYAIAVLVNRDSSVDITEDISVNFTEPRHGLFRNIPFHFMGGVTEADSANFPSAISVTEISVEEKKFSIEKENGYFNIRIGDPAVYVTGMQHYRLHYKLRDLFNFEYGFPIFRFNVVGNQWDRDIPGLSLAVKLYRPLDKAPAYTITDQDLHESGKKIVSSWNRTNSQLDAVCSDTIEKGKGITLLVDFPKDFFSK